MIVLRFWNISLLVLLALLWPLTHGWAAESFPLFLEQIKKESLAKGIAPAVVAQHLSGITFDPRVVQRDSYQPEFTITPQSYIARAVTPKRVAQGKAMMVRYAALLQKIEQRYAVSRHVIVAIWGLESSYGATTGKYNILRSLVTLAYNGRRATYARRQIFTVLELLEKGRLPKETLLGSWAGAFGQTQFIPTSFKQYAVDGDGNGQIDLRHNVADALASTANYLAKSGWKAGVAWGEKAVIARKVSLKDGVEKKWQSVADWRRLGVQAHARSQNTTLQNTALQNTTVARLMFADSFKKKPYLVSKNFNVILRYNASNAYALAIGVLSDKLQQASQTNFSLKDTSVSQHKKKRVTGQKARYQAKARY